MGGWNLLGGLMPPAVDTAGESERCHSRDSGAEEEFEILESKEIKEHRHYEDSGNSSQDEEKILGDEGVSAVSHNKDLSLEDAILANFPDGCNRSFIVESKDEDSYDIIPKNLTFAETINILNQAIKEDYEKLDKIIQNIEEYEGRSITLDSTNLKDFCEQQLNLDLRNNHHIYSNILSQYKFDQVELTYDYLVKELVLLAIAADDKLAEKYQDILFAEENLSLLPLLVGGQEYIKAFIEKFHSIDEVYNKIKDQIIQLVEPNKIGFFSTIALRKEQELLETVLAEPFLRDLEHVLKTSDPDPLYGMLETAPLVKNEKFIMIVLNAFERYVNEPTKDIQDLLKGSFVTLLETAISQEHLTIIEYLCKRYINNKGSTSYDIYEQAFADDRVIKVLNQQILKNIEARDRKKIYDLVLKTALDAGNIEFIEHLCEEYAQCSKDIIDYLNQKLKNNEFDNVYESALIALSNLENKDIVIDVIAHVQTYQSISHNEQVTRKVIQNLLRNAVRYSTDQEDYSLIKKVCYLCTESDEISVIFREECEIFKSSIEKLMEDLERENKLLQSEALHEYNYDYVLGVANGLAQVAHAGYGIYTEDPKYNKRQENTDLILNLMHIRNILQFSIDVQEYSCTERQGLWDQMYSTPATFIIRKKSDNIADRSTISAIGSDVLSENSESQSTDSKQLQRSIVDKRENIITNKKASQEAIDNNYRRGKMPKNTKTIEEKLSDAIFADRSTISAIESDVLSENSESQSTDSKQLQRSIVDKRENIITNKKASQAAIDNNYRRGKMPKNTKIIEEKLSDAIFDLNYEEVISLIEQVKQENNSVDAKQILTKALEDASKTEVSKKDRASKRKLAEIKIFLEKEFEHIVTALPAGDDVGATANSQQIPVKEVKERESDSSLLSSEDNDFSKLEGDKSDAFAGTSSDSNSNSPFEEINEESHEIRIPIIETVEPEATASASEMPSMITEKKPGNIEDDNYVSVSSDQGQDAQPEVLASELEIENINNDITVNQSAGRVEQMANEDTQSEPVIAAGIVSRIESDSPSLSSEDDKLESDDSARISSNSPSFEVIDEAETSISTAPEMAKFEVAASTPKMPSIVTKEKVSNIKEDDNDVSASSDKGQDEQLKLVIPIADEQSSESNQKTTALDTKKYIVAASALAITGIALGVAVAVYLEMLAIGIAIPACCLIAATVTYCSRPKSLIEDNEVEKVDDTQKSTPCCG